MITLDRDRLAGLRTTVALLNLPVRLDTDGPTVVVHLPRDLDTSAEVRVLREVEKVTDDFRCRIA